jgi:protein MON2
MMVIARRRMNPVQHGCASLPWKSFGGTLIIILLVFLGAQVFHSLCSDGDLMRGIWQRYEPQRAGSNVFATLITALKQLVSEKPALLGVGTQIMGLGVAPSYSVEGSGGYGSDVGSVAGMVANAASATMSGVVGMMGSEA